MSPSAANYPDRLATAAAILHELMGRPERGKDDDKAASSSDFANIHDVPMSCCGEAVDEIRTRSDDEQAMVWLPVRHGYLDLSLSGNLAGSKREVRRERGSHARRRHPSIASALATFWAVCHRRGSPA